MGKAEADKIDKEIDQRSDWVKDAKKEADKEKDKDKKAQKLKEIEDEECFISGLVAAKNAARKAPPGASKSVAAINADRAEEVEKDLGGLQKELADAQSKGQHAKVKEIQRRIECVEAQIRGKDKAKLLLLG